MRKATRGRPALAVLTATLLLSPAHGAAPYPSDPGPHVAVSCRGAVADSRMLCVSAANCQREISAILRACSAPERTACRAARENVRSACRSSAPWYDTRECKGALRQVSQSCDP